MNRMRPTSHSMNRLPMPNPNLKGPTNSLTEALHMKPSTPVRVNSPPNCTVTANTLPLSTDTPRPANEYVALRGHTRTKRQRPGRGRASLSHGPLQPSGELHERAIETKRQARKDGTFESGKSTSCLQTASNGTGALRHMRPFSPPSWTLARTPTV